MSSVGFNNSLKSFTYRIEKYSVYVVLVLSPVLSTKDNCLTFISVFVEKLDLHSSCHPQNELECPISRFTCYVIYITSRHDKVINYYVKNQFISIPNFYFKSIIYSFWPAFYYWASIDWPFPAKKY